MAGLTIAIDYDDTFTADASMWRRVIAEMHKAGHRVVCVSARRNEIGHRQELTQALPDGVAVMLSYDTPKRMFAKDEGIDVDIWIDDMPESIPTKRDMQAVCW